MLFVREEMDFDVVLQALQSGPGLTQLLLGVLCLLLGVFAARNTFRRWFMHHPERYDRFIPYTAFRLVLPLVALVSMLLCIMGWMMVMHTRPHLLPLFTAMLFWLGVIRLFTAVMRQALPQGKFERNSEHFIATVLWLGFVSWAIGFDEVMLDWLQSVSFSVGKSRLDLLTILNAMLWVSIIVVVALWVSRVIEARVMALKHMDLSLRIVFAKMARTLLIVVAVLIALPVVGIDLTVLSVFGGAVGVGLGFGLQKIASNYVSGFIILLDRSIRIGDRLMVDNRVGYVTRITSRYVVLKSADGSEALVPNDALISNTVINQSYSDKSMWISLPIQVDYGTDLDQALAVLRESAVNPRVKTDPAPAAFVTAFADSGINLELGIWVKDPENGFMGLRSEIYLAIWRRFKELGIEIPYPQRDVRIVSDVAVALPGRGEQG
ncbi:mechanosensitive ion channel family protein [Aquitalea sp. USM4]|uniref:mechanosensitive ion channel family protein n=1 Tax=Aquitalea sp. USM4 TaxID=1590041 RepID=UPI00103CCFFF|nr:mechanosensitive ion channel domain-containing protein [Aquitalea sp. USM4]QBJ76880.1 mechanosensitive ion channel protein MscS [Aquitalea sp. USM4]